MTNKVGDEIGGFVFPKRRLILQWERYLQSMESHDSLNRDQSLFHR